MRKTLSIVLAGLLVILLPVEQVLAQAAHQDSTTAKASLVPVEQVFAEAPAARLLRVPPLTENTALLLGATAALPAQENPLPQGVRVRVWAPDVGRVTGIMSGQLETVIMLSNQRAGRCRELVAERVQFGFVGGIRYYGGESEYIPSECPLDTVLIPGKAITRIDISEGMRGHTGRFAVVGAIAGFIAGPVIMYADGERSAGGIIVIGSAVGLVTALIGGLAGEIIGSQFDGEDWRQIR